MKSTDKKYIGITQGCGGIIKMNGKIPDNFGGFYTDKIKTCLGIVLHKEDKKKHRNQSFALRWESV